MNEIINIVLCSDDNYAQHIAVVIASIMTKTKAKICFFVIDDNISEEKIQKLAQTAASFNAEINFIKVLEEKFSNVYLSGHVSKAAYFRLVLPEILPDNINKVMYLDVDLIVLDDIQKIWQCDLQQLPLAAIEDYGIMASGRLCKQKQQVISLPIGEKYFNSGVLLIDLQKWRQGNYTKKIIELINNNKFPHHDQDALNKIFMKKWKALDLRWNVIPPVFYLFNKVVFNKKFRSNAVKAKLDIGILHYAGSYKPWQFALHNGFNDKYYYYLSFTAFKNEKMPQPAKNMKGKSILRQLLRLKKANFLVKLLKNNLNQNSLKE